MPLVEERVRLAREVLSSLNPDYVEPNCCVLCGQQKMQFEAAALNPSGERKGICAPCSRSHQFGLSFHSQRRSGDERVVFYFKRIEAGFYD